MLIEIVLKALEDRVFGLLVALEVVAVAELLNGLFLFAAECTRHIDTDVYHEIALAGTIALYSRQSLTAQTECLARLCSIIELHLQLGSFYRRNLNITAQGCCGEVEQQVINQVVAVANE